MAKTIVGLEVTEESVRAAELSVGRKPQLLAFGDVPLPREAARDSEVLDAGAVAMALRQLWTAAGLTSRRVVLGVASRRILVREYTTQALRPDLLREALPYQVQDLLPVPANQAVLDFYPLTHQGDQVSGLLVAAASENIEQIIDTLGRVKVRPQAVDLGGFGLARATAALSAPGASAAIVNIGDHTTQVVVVRDGIPHFIRILPIDVPTAAARRHTASSEPEPAVEPADGRSGARAAARRSLVRGDSHSPATSVATDLAARVRNTLAFFAGRPHAAPLSEVLVTGAGAAVAGVMPALAAALDAPTRTVTVTEVIATAGEPPDGDLALNLVATVGIALGEATR